MKKIIKNLTLFAAAAGLMLSLAACGSSENQEAVSENTQQSTKRETIHNPPEGDPFEGVEGNISLYERMTTIVEVPPKKLKSGKTAECVANYSGGLACNFKN